MTNQPACVKESLRIGMPVPGRLPRVVPYDLAQPLVVDNQVIPPGVSTPALNRKRTYW